MSICRFGLLRYPVGAVKATASFQIVDLDQADSGSGPGSIHYRGVSSGWQMENGCRFEIVCWRDPVLLQREGIRIRLPVVIRGQDGTVLVENAEAWICEGITDSS